MLVPVMGLPRKLTLALIAVLVLEVGPCQYSTARVTVPVIPLTTKVREPLLRMEPTPKVAKSVLLTTKSCVKGDA
jgi:hypothetical protein